MIAPVPGRGQIAWVNDGLKEVHFRPIIPDYAAEFAIDPQEIVRRRHRIVQR